MAQIAIVQARTSSQRLPGKVLREVAGRTLLEYLFDRIGQCQSLDGFVVATSDQASDDRLVRLCEHLGVRVHRGPLDDVVARFLGVTRLLGLDSFVRINGDSPLIDPAVVDRGVGLLEGCRCDLVTNVFPRSFPKGQSVEVISTRALERVAGATRDPEDLEHVTRYFYCHPAEFRITNFSYRTDASDIQLSVDSAEDLARFEALVALMNRPPAQYGLEELLGLIQHPACSQI